MPLNLITHPIANNFLSRLAQTYNEYVTLHTQRPEYWTRREIYQNCREVIRTNLNVGVNRYNHYPTAKTPRWYAVDNRAMRRVFADSLARAFRDGDEGEAISLVNNPSIQFIRENGTTDYEDLLREKLDRSDIYQCEDCNTIAHEDDGHWTYDSDYWVCDSCCDDNYRWSDSRDTYITLEDYEEEQEDEYDEEEDGVIGDYHDSKRVLGHIPSKYDAYKSPDNKHRPILLGMELEVEVSEDYERTDKAEELYEAIKYVTDINGNTQQYCFTENDGSLNHGFEIVTGYTGLDVHAKQLQFFKSPWRGVRSHDTRTCGLHVHIDKAGMSLFHACKMVFFIHDSNNQKLIKDIARRANADYAQIKNKKASYQWLKRAKSSHNPINYLNEDRREALNFQNDNTIEFRLFKGTLRYETIMACLEFTYATWFF